MTHHSPSAGAFTAVVPAGASCSLPNGVVSAGTSISSAAATASSQPVAAASLFGRSKYASTFLTAADNSIQLTSVTVALKGLSMRSVYEEKLARASKNARMIVQGDARVCSALNFGKVCKALWPFKTAEALAAIVGCSVRAAAYEISGEREPSAQSILAVVEAIIPKRERA